MGQFIVGNVVAVNFPFSDLSGKKRRPAVIIADVGFDDYIYCQITSRDRSKLGAIKITNDDFVQGNLPITSYVRPDKLFTGESSVILKTRGSLKQVAIRKILEAVREIFQD